MLLGKVIGSVVSSQKDPQLEGLVFQVLQVLDMQGKPANNYVVAIDAVGAGVLPINSDLAQRLFQLLFRTESNINHHDRFGVGQFKLSELIPQQRLAFKEVILTLV